MPTPPDTARARARSMISRPGAADDKYSRGVLGLWTGSNAYPGAAVLGAEAALRTGIGMLRYLGTAVPRDLVLARRPEAVPGDGRIDCLVIGSGMEPLTTRDLAAVRARNAADAGIPLVLDAGALPLAAELREHPLIVLTPHAGEAARLLGDRDRRAVAADPRQAAQDISERLNAVVVLKGSQTLIASPTGAPSLSPAASPWLASAGTGDVLAAVIGALIAAQASNPDFRNENLPELAATGVYLHSAAAATLAQNGPLLALELATAIGAEVRTLLAAEPA